MLRRSFFRTVVALAFVALAVGLCSSEAQTTKRGRKYKAPPPTSRIEVTVTRDGSTKPIENASVIFHTIKDPGNMELKTNEDGKTVIDVLPIGETVRLQIIAKGFQTYGQDYKIEKPEMAINVEMKRPAEQYSIYKDHNGDPKDGNSDTDKDNKSDKPSEDKKPDDKPNQPQLK